jgi:hypothetical protein
MMPLLTWYIVTYNLHHSKGLKYAAAESQIGQHIKMEIHDGEEISTVVAPQQFTTKVKTRVEMIGDVLEDARRNHGGNGFPIDLDNVWGLLGYTQKGHAARMLCDMFKEGTSISFTHLHACSSPPTRCSWGATSCRWKDYIV